MSNQDSSRKSGTEPNKAEMTRRSAIKGMATGTAASAFALSSVCVASNAFGSNLMQPHAMTFEDWNPLLGNKFHVQGLLFCKTKYNEQADAELRLEQVIENDWSKDPSRPLNLRRSSISLLFSSNKEIPNTTYAIKHGKLGKSHLFLHEVSRDELFGRKVYEVVLN
jgi:hypothetical protein